MSSFDSWLKLAGIKGLGLAKKIQLLRFFGTVHAIFSARRHELVDCLNEHFANIILNTPDPDSATKARLEQWLSHTGHHLLTWDSPAYPASLLEAFDPPLMIYAHGDMTLLKRPAVSIVGSRNASEQGRINAQFFAEQLGSHGYTIISGMASGIDTAAHEGALKTPASTIAVLGTGIDRIFTLQK